MKKIISDVISKIRKILRISKSEEKPSRLIEEKPSKLIEEK